MRLAAKTLAMVLLTASRVQDASGRFTTYRKGNTLTALGSTESYAVHLTGLVGRMGAINAQEYTEDMRVSFDRMYKFALANGVDVKAGDRISDTVTGIVCTVTGVKAETTGFQTNTVVFAAREEI